MLQTEEAAFSDPVFFQRTPVFFRVIRLRPSDLLPSFRLPSFVLVPVLSKCRGPRLAVEPSYNLTTSCPARAWLLATRRLSQNLRMQKM